MSFAESTHDVDIFGFIEAQNIPSLHFGQPFILTPSPGGELSYTLLRETLDRTRKVGLAYVIIQSCKHLAILAPCGGSLQLTTLHCVGEAKLFGHATHEASSGRAQTGYKTERQVELDAICGGWTVARYGDMASPGIADPCMWDLCAINDDTGDAHEFDDAAEDPDDIEREIFRASDWHAGPPACHRGLAGPGRIRRHMKPTSRNRKPLH